MSPKVSRTAWKPWGGAGQATAAGGAAGAAAVVAGSDEPAPAETGAAAPAIPEDPVAELEREFSELKANLEYEEPTPDGAESIKRKGGWKWKKNTKSANVN